MSPLFTPFSARFCGILFLLLAFSATASAQSLKVTGHTQAGSQITITVLETGSSTGYRLESSPGLVVPAWTTVAATFTPVPGQSGFFRTTITPPTTDRLFYRIVGMSGTADDTDGDGLSNVFELSLGTSSTGYDSDGDGFSDGVEYAFNTTAFGPAGPASKPDQATLPAIAFTTSVSAVSEGTATAVLTLQADRPFSGLVTYAVKTRSTAKAPADYSIAGSTPAPVATPQWDDRVGTIAFNGTSATLTVQLNDNLTVSPARLLIVELDPSSAVPATYRTGGRITHVINITDNDAYWSGVLTNPDSERNFRLRVLQDAAGRQVDFVSGSSDGLPVADSGASSQSTGIVPSKTAAGASQEVWPADNLTVPPSTSVFNFRSPAMPFSSAGFIGQGVKLTSTVTLNASVFLGVDRMSGTLSEVIAPADASQTWLARTRAGSFSLYRDLPGPPALTSTLAP